MSTLLQNLSSEYLEATNYFYSKRSPLKVYAYVESYDDIPFWRTVLTDFEDGSLCFQIMVPSATSLQKGKKKVLSLVAPEGKFLIKCVDSDYDYLLQGATDSSRLINQSKYIFQTYTYSIENYYCMAEGLHTACVRAVLNDRQEIDWVCFLKSYSTLVYPLFLWSVCLYKEGKEALFPIAQFCQVISLVPADLMNGLESLKGKITERLRLLESENRLLCPLISGLSEELASLGVREENVYWFIHGHSILSSMLGLLGHICSKLKKERMEEIKSLAKTEEERNNDIKYYLDMIQDIENVLEAGVNYKSSEPYRKIQEDLCAYVKEFC